MHSRRDSLAAFVSATLAVVLAAAFGAGTTSAEQTGTSRLAYDAFGDRVRSVSALGGERLYEHGWSGSETALSYDGAPMIEDARFGPHGRLERYTYAGSGSRAERLARFDYDPLGRQRTLSLETAGTAGFDYRADALGYDERGFVTGYRREDRAVGAVEVGFLYTPQGQLDTFFWGSSGLTYRYDPRGNLTHRSGGLGVPPHAPIAYGIDNRHPDWRYDGAARVLEDDEHLYEYDARGRLRLLRDKASGTWLAHYLYDDQGHRTRVLEPDRATYIFRDDTGAVTAEEVRHRSHEVSEQREHVLFNGASVLEVTYASDGGTEQEMRFADRLGNPAVTWTDDSETVHEYSPYGLAMEVGAATPHEGAHGFTGHEVDPTGLTYMRARYYDPDAARFTTPDPARDFARARPATFNLYQYAYGNPVGFVDPTGTSGEPAPRPDQAGVYFEESFSDEEIGRILQGLNEFTGNTYDLDENRILRLVEVGPGSSELATVLIEAASLEKVTVQRKASGRNEASMGTGIVELNPNRFKHVEYPRKFDRRAYNLGSSLVHELFHVTTLQGDGSNAFEKGPAVDFVNHVRTERDFGFTRTMHGMKNRSTSRDVKGVEFDCLGCRFYKKVVVWHKKPRRPSK